jgi:hypothetical protein
MRRGALALVPTVPGLVSDTVVPMKSSGEIVPLRDRGHQLVEGLDELGEVHPPRVLDVGDEERARAVLLLDVDRDAQPHLVALDAVGLPSSSA